MYELGIDAFETRDMGMEAFSRRLWIDVWFTKTVLYDCMCIICWIQ